MPGDYFNFNECKDMLGLKPNAKLQTVIRECERHGYPYRRGRNSVFIVKDELIGKQQAEEKRIELA